ncbi:hypothetical protein OH807_11885 [Kitasatospora sp. NBC_01560]|uniref:hypothetical protein n=1 Tax=Kitasatospora sp. NBC_01560 TaxID=2975965 RepID=UPI00386A5DFF
MSDLTIEVVDRINPVTLAQGEALRRLWRQVVELDLCSSQHEAMRRQLCGETPEVLATLAVEGTAGWTLDLRHGVQVVMRLSRPGARSVQQRVGDRYVQVQLPSTRRCPGLWAIRDTESGELVRQENEAGTEELLRFAVEQSASAWVARQINLAGYRATRGLTAGGAP